MLFKLLFNLKDGIIRFVTRVDDLQLALIFISMQLSILTHPVDFFFADTARALDFDLGLFASTKILGSDFENAVGI